MSETKLVRGRWVVTEEACLSDAALRIEDGRIAEVGAWSDLQGRYPAAPVLGSERFAVLPGLINAHHHSSGATVLQQGIADQPLEAWLLGLGLCRPLDAELATLLSAARLLRSGITSVVEVHSGRGTAEAYEERARRALAAYDKAGLRVAFAAGLTTQSFLVHGPGEDERFIAGLPAALRGFARSYLPPPGSLDEDDYFGVMEDLLHSYRAHPRIEVWYAPPGPPYVSDACLIRSAEAAERHDTSLQTHVAESLYEKLYGPRTYGGPVVFHLQTLGLLGPRASLAHGVWLSEPEIALLAESGAAVVLNPSSNLRLSAGIAPLNALLASGATVALGMDGTTLNDDEDFFTEMRLALRLNRAPGFEGGAPTPAQIFRLATAGGARLLRKEGRLGAIAPGRAADLVLLDLTRPTWPWVAPETNPRDLLLLRAGAGDVDSVLIGGELVLSQGRPTRFDLEEVGREAAARLRAAPYPAERARLLAELLPHLEAHYRAWPQPALSPYVIYNARS